jgi:hypothetical protein
VQQKLLFLDQLTKSHTHEKAEDFLSLNRFLQHEIKTKQYLRKEVKRSKKKYYEMKTHTHNKTTKLRKFLLMKHNRNIPKFSSANKKKFILSESKTR